MNRTCYTLFMIFFLLLIGKNSYAQTIFCPPNIDFEQNNYSNWKFYTGSCCPISTPVQSGPVSGPVNYRHVLTPNAVILPVDTFGNFPTVAPGSGNHSLRLGDQQTGALAEMAQYQVQVPPAPGKYVLIYRYAVVLEDPGHAANHQPRFEVRAYDSATGAPIPCNSHTYVSSSTLPGFYISPKKDSGVIYKPWTAATLDLSDFNGKTVTVEFATGDCAETGHFAYAYIDVNCGLFQISATVCNNEPFVTLKGPPGFQNYKWMNTSFTTILGTKEVIYLPTPPVPTQYAVIVTPYPGFGCPDTFYTTYNVISDSLKVIAPVKSFCEHGSVLLNASSGNANGPLQHTWWPANGLNCITCSNPVASPTATTTYHVSIENKYGCKDTADVTVTVHPSPDASAGKDTTVCRGSTIQLEGKGNSVATKFQWFPSAGLDDPNVAQPNAAISGPINYMLIVMSDKGCRDTDYVDIATYPAVYVFAGNDTAVCPGDTIMLSGDGDGDLRWFPDAALSDSATKNPTAIISKTIDYYLEVTNSYGCKDTDVVAITLIPMPEFKITADTIICKGDTLQLHASGGQVYYWHSDYSISGRNTPQPYVWPTQKHNYAVTITETLCDRSDTLDVDVTVNPTGQLRVVATPIVCGGELIGQLTAYGGTNYQWIPSAYLSDPNAGITKANPPTSTLYTVTAINGYGCADTVSALLEVFADAGIYSPNAFTPNGDGLNDCYKMVVTGNIITFEMYIFNRWGQEVFHSKNYSDCWNGMYKGDRVDPGSYYYFYKATSPLCGEIFRKGDILVIR